MARRWRDPLCGAAVGALALLLLQIGVLEWLLAPVAMIDFFLLLLVSAFLPKPAPHPSVVPVPQFHWLAMPLASILLVLLFALAGWGLGALARRFRSQRGP